MLSLPVLFFCVPGGEVDASDFRVLVEYFVARLPAAPHAADAEVAEVFFVLGGQGFALREVVFGHGLAGCYVEAATKAFAYPRVFGYYGNAYRLHVGGFYRLARAYAAFSLSLFYVAEVGEGAFFIRAVEGGYFLGEGCGGWYGGLCGCWSALFLRDSDAAG